MLNVVIEQSSGMFMSSFGSEGKVTLCISTTISVPFRRHFMLLKYQDVEKPAQKFSETISAILTQVVQFLSKSVLLLLSWVQDRRDR